MIHDYLRGFSSGLSIVRTLPRMENGKIDSRRLFKRLRNDP
jgi:hypothetical protein